MSSVVIAPYSVYCIHAMLSGRRWPVKDGKWLQDEAMRTGCAMMEKELPRIPLG